MSEQTNDTPFRYTAAMARADRDLLAGPVGGGRARSTPPTPPVRGPSRRRWRPAARSSSSSTCSRTPVGRGPARRPPARATSRPTSTAASTGCSATTSCTRWATTPSACPPSSTPSRPGSTLAKTTEENMTNMKRQLRRLGLGFDNRRSVATIDDDYYRWTQWIFLQIWDAWYDAEAVREDGGRGKARPISELVEEFESGRRAVVDADGRGWADLSATERATVLEGHRLAYTSEAPVNWCPGLGTVLSNEEVTNEGRSERGNFPVFRRNLQPVDAAHHRVRRPPGRRPRPASTGPRRSSSCSATGSAAVQGRARRLPGRHRHGRAGRHRPSSPRAPTRSSARRSWCSRPSTRSWTRWCRKATGPTGPRMPGRAREQRDPEGGRRGIPARGVTQERRRAPDRGQGQDRRLHRLVRRPTP